MPGLSDRAVSYRTLLGFLVICNMLQLSALSRVDDGRRIDMRRPYAHSERRAEEIERERVESSGLDELQCSI